MTVASKVEWEGRITPRISKEEFPAGVLDKMNLRIIELMSDLRERSGVAMFPSPEAGAHVREIGNSRHSTKEGTRLSDAVDFFCSWEGAARVLQETRRIYGIGGIGIYTDMIFRGQPEGVWCMFHIDARPERLEWVGWRESQKHKTQYVYFNSDPAGYHKVLAERARW